MSATVKHISSNSSADLNRYLESEQKNADTPRVMYEWGQHCRPETAAADFRALRIAHGRQGELRRLPASYVVPEHPTDATHLKVGKNWRAAKEHETATHRRIEPAEAYQRSAEAYHFIFSFDLESVNPEDPEQTQSAFDAVVAFREQYSPGTQSRFVAQNDAKGSKAANARGEGGKFHVHEAMNSVIARDMVVEGRHYEAGQRVAGPITHVDTYRRRWDQFLAERGHEFGLKPQDRTKLPEIGSEAYRAVRKTDRDHFAREAGELSPQDRARRGVETAYAALAEDPAALRPLDESQRITAFSEAVARTGDAELSLRTTKAGDVKLRSYRVTGTAKPISQSKLGERYSDVGIRVQLERIAQGTWKPLEPCPQQKAPRPVTQLFAAELAAAQREASAAAAV